MTSGFGISGCADRKEMIVCAYAIEIADSRGAVWKDPALKKYGDSNPEQYNQQL